MQREGKEPFLCSIEVVLPAYLSGDWLDTRYETEQDKQTCQRHTTASTRGYRVALSLERHFCRPEHWLQWL
jgi:hypothetical protein